MFKITVQDHFSATMHLPKVKGPCQKPHTHQYRVRLCLERQQLNEQGLVVDFYALKALLREIIAELDQKNLNALAMFHSTPPSAEHLCFWIFEELRDKILALDATLCSVEIHEDDTSAASYHHEG
jgi:6-pyruvoyltetrahydropterin/6-carboxytetrahydropterin synthase